MFIYDTFFRECNLKPQKGLPVSTYREVFPHRHTVLVVIHVVTLEQALRNIRVAQEGGADGVLLINHDIRAAELISIFQVARAVFPGYWMGINLLDVFGPMQACELMSNADGLWIDDAGVDDMGDTYEAEFFRDTCLQSPRDCLYFGSVAFKGQDRVANPAEAARRAMPFMDVIVTSGDRTGEPPTVDKMNAMRTAIGDHPLAIASGVSSANVHTFLPSIDCIIVSTGISDSHTETNIKKLRRLMFEVRSFKG